MKDVVILIRNTEDLKEVVNKLSKEGYIWKSTNNLNLESTLKVFKTSQNFTDFSLGGVSYIRIVKSVNTLNFSCGTNYNHCLNIIKKYNAGIPILEASQYLNKPDKIDITKIKEDSYAIEIESIDDLRRLLLYYLTLGFQELQQYSDWYNFRTNLEDILCQIDINSEYKYLYISNSSNCLSLYPLRYIDKNTIYKSSDIVINKDGNKIEKSLVKSILSEIIVDGEVVKNYNKILSAVNKLLNETE